MVKRYFLISTNVALLIVILFSISVLADENNVGRKIYFFTNSGACPCQQRACDRAKPVAAEIRKRLAENVEFVELDYALQPEKTQVLTQKYKLFTFPAFLVVDAEGNELFKSQGKFNKHVIIAALEELGVIKKIESGE